MRPLNIVFSIQHPLLFFFIAAHIQPESFRDYAAVTSQRRALLYLTESVVGTKKLIGGKIAEWLRIVVSSAGMQ